MTYQTFEMDDTTTLTTILFLEWQNTCRWANPRELSMNWSQQPGAKPSPLNALKTYEHYLKNLIITDTIETKLEWWWHWMIPMNSDDDTLNTCAIGSTDPPRSFLSPWNLLDHKSLTKHLVDEGNVGNNIERGGELVLSNQYNFFIFILKFIYTTSVKTNHMYTQLYVMQQVYIK